MVDETLDEKIEKLNNKVQKLEERLSLLTIQYQEKSFVAKKLMEKLLHRQDVLEEKLWYLEYSDD